MHTRSIRITLVATLGLLCLPACGAQLYIVRTPVAVDGGQKGDPNTEQLQPCKTLNPGQAEACVFTVESCPYGLQEVRLSKTKGGFEATATCLAPAASDPGDSPI